MSIESCPRILVSINNKRDFFDISSSGSYAPVGSTTTFHFTPKVHTSSDSLKSLSCESRHCRLHNEIPEGEEEFTLFKEYTQKSCSFQQRLKVAATVMGCIPYYMPTRRVDDLRYCNGEEATEFVKILSNTTIMDRLGGACPQGGDSIEKDFS